MWAEGGPEPGNEFKGALIYISREVMHDAVILLITILGKILYTFRPDHEQLPDKCNIDPLVQQDCVQGVYIAQRGVSQKGNMR